MSTEDRTVGWRSRDIVRTAALVIGMYLLVQLLWFANKLVLVAFLGVLFGLAVKDVNFSFKLFHRSLLQKITLKSEGSFIDAEFLVRARKSGASIIQIGVDYFPRTRGVSTLSSPSVIVKLLREMFALRRELRAIQPVART